MIGLLVSFALLVLLCFLCLLALYYREQLKKWWHQRASAIKYSVPTLPTIKLTSRNKSPRPPPPPPGSTGGQEPKATTAMVRNGYVSVEISPPVLQDSTPNQSQASSHTIKMNKQSKPPPARQVNMETPKRGESMEPRTQKTSQSAFSKILNRSNEDNLSFPSFSKLLSRSKNESSPKPSPKPPLKQQSSNPLFQPTDPIVKKDSFNRDKEISKPVLISTTDRRSKAFVKDASSDSLGDDRGFSFADSSIPPPPAPGPRQATPRRNRVTRPPRPTSLPPQPNKGKQRKEAEKQQARKSVVDPGARSPPRPPPPNLNNQSQPFSQQQEMQMQPIGQNNNQTRRLNLNPNLHTTRKPSSFDEPNPVPTPRVFLENGRNNIDTKPSGLTSSSPKTSSATSKKPEKHLSGETKPSGRFPLSTNATKTSFDLKGKTSANASNNNNKITSDPRSESSHSKNIPDTTARGLHHISDNGPSKRAYESKPRPTGDVSKPRKPSPKVSTRSTSHIRETDIIDDNANTDSESGCVAEIKAMFDGMDIGFNLSDSPDKESTPSPEMSKVNRNDSGSGDRPKPPPKPGQVLPKVKPGQGQTKGKPGKSLSKVRSVNV